MCWSWSGRGCQNLGLLRFEAFIFGGPVAGAGGVEVGARFGVMGLFWDGLGMGLRIIVRSWLRLL